jgi:hypothetical protein
VTRCSVCRLPQARREAVDAALRSEQVSLQEISISCGFSKSALHRHRQHLSAVATAEPAQNLPVPASRTVAMTEPAASLGTTAAKLEANPPTATRTQLLRRLELLWDEALDGLEASKEPVQVQKPDGSIVEIRDLRARASFIREARSVVGLTAEVSGELAGPNINIQIVVPGGIGGPVSDPGEVERGPVIDITPQRR